MESTVLKNMHCPNCNKPMTHGYIAGHWFRLRWTQKEKTLTVFAGHPLRRVISWFSSPTVEAVRCETCKVGIFRYDY